MDSKACLSAVLWCCGFVRLRLWCWGPVGAHSFHSFPFSSMQFISPCFFCLVVLSGSGSSSPLYRGSVFLQSCNLQSCRALVSCCPVFVGLWLEFWGPIFLHLAPNTNKLLLQSITFDQYFTSHPHTPPPTPQAVEVMIIVTFNLHLSGTVFHISTPHPPRS